MDHYTTRVVRSVVGLTFAVASVAGLIANAPWLFRSLTNLVATPATPARAKAAHEAPVGDVADTVHMTFPWQGLAIGAGITVAVLLAGFLTVVAIRAVAARRREKVARAAAAAEKWEDATGRHDRILRLYLDMETDALAALTLPALFATAVDEKSPVAMFLAALDSAASRRTENMPASMKWLERYMTAVSELERCWEGARSYARAVGTSGLSGDTARKVSRAVSLVRKGQVTANAFEQKACFDTARRLLGEIASAGELRVPARQLDALEAKSRLAIERGTPADPTIPRPLRRLPVAGFLRRGLARRAAVGARTIA